MVSTITNLEPVQSSYHPDISKMCFYVPTNRFYKLPDHCVSNFPR